MDIEYEINFERSYIPSILKKLSFSLIWIFLDIPIIQYIL